MIHWKFKQKGQGMTEYLIIVALIAVAAIGVYGLFGSTVRHQVAAMAAEIGGQSGADSVKRAEKTGNKATKLSANNETVSLSTYDDTASKALK